MPPDPTPPLPLAANRAALSNRISMLLASQSSVLKTMSLTRPPPSSSSTRRIPLPDDDADLRAARPNEGVGYVPDAKDAARIANAREERMLRGRVAKGNGKSRRKEDSESEDDVGRSALGKRKRPRREADKVDTGSSAPHVEESADVDMGDDTKVEDAKGEEGLAQPATIAHEHSVQEGDEGAKKKRKRKNKNKKKKPNTIQAQT